MYTYFIEHNVLSSNIGHINRDKFKILRYILLDSHKFLISFEKYLKYFNNLNSKNKILSSVSYAFII